jgi:hypothetical protein
MNRSISIQCVSASSASPVRQTHLCVSVRQCVSASIWTHYTHALHTHSGATASKRQCVNDREGKQRCRAKRG